MNEINILMNFKHISLLSFLRQYQDQHNVYILYEYWVGDPLYRLYLQGVKMQATQIANLINQILKVLKLLHQEGIYHGNVTPANIIVLRQPQQNFKVVLKNFAYREQPPNNNYAWITRRLPPQWVPPEVSSFVDDVSTNIDPSKIDSYLVGCTLLYMLGYTPPANMKGKDVPFLKSVENFRISYSDIDGIQKVQLQQFDQSSTFTSIDHNILGTS